MPSARSEWPRDAICLRCVSKALSAPFFRSLCRIVGDAVAGLHPEARERGRLLFRALVAFCDRSGYSDEQAAVACAILLEVMDADLKAGGRPVATSVEHLQTDLLKHAVQRPPRSRSTFLPSEAVALFDFLSKLYHRHFRLISYCLGAVPDLSLQQIAVGGNDEPAALPPLCEGVLLLPPAGAAGAASAASSSSDIAPAATAAVPALAAAGGKAGAGSGSNASIGGAKPGKA